MAYNYLEAMREDIEDYLSENTGDIDADILSDRDELEQYLNDELWTVDSVTGNASGSYTFNSNTAKANLDGNGDLIKEMVGAFSIDAATVGERFVNGDYEWFDVSIRCYLLGQAIAETLDALENEGFFEGGQKVYYYGYMIEKAVFGYTVLYNGDEVVFDTIEEAKQFINEIKREASA